MYDLEKKYLKDYENRAERFYDADVAEFYYKIKLDYFKKGLSKIQKNDFDKVEKALHKYIKQREIELINFIFEYKIYGNHAK